MPDYNLNIERSITADWYRRQWLARNRGVLSQVAKQLKPRVSPQFVRLVFWGERRSRRVERALRRRLAPGFEASGGKRAA